MFVFILFFLPEVALVTDWQKLFVSFSFIAYLGVSDNDQTYQMTRHVLSSYVL